MNANLNDLTVTGIGVSAFDRVGLEDVLPEYNILVIQNAKWVRYFPELFSHVHILSQLDPTCTSETTLNTNSALGKADWVKIQKVLGVENLLIYKPIRGQEEFSKKTGIRILANSYSLAQRIENKCEFRRLMGAQVPLPEYVMYTFEDMNGVEYAYFKDLFGDFVVQDSTLSAGRGTFFVRDEREYRDCLRVLGEHGSIEVVVSKFIVGDSSSVQVCVTKYGVFSLPPQRQVIAQGELVNIKRDMADKFNGGQWVRGDFSDVVQEKIKACALVIGEKLSELGYKGIFGIDFISTPESEVYIIEVNARITGMTPVITGIQKRLRQIPFLLLHTLEHLGVDYQLSEVEIEEIKAYGWEDDHFGYMILFNVELEPFMLGTTLKPGVYRIERGRIVFARLGYKVSDLVSNDEFLLLDVKEKGDFVLPNRRMGRIITLSPVIDSRGELLPTSLKIVQSVRSALT